YLPGAWAADGSGFHLVTDAGSEFRGLAFYELGANRWDWVEEPRHDVEDLKVSADGRVLAWLVNEDGYDRLQLRELDGGRELPTPELPAGARPHLTGAQPAPALSPDGSHAALRVSTGYGKSYQRLVQRDWGGGDMRDWEHAAKWLRAQDWVDPNRIGVFGGSYGGFAVLTCVTRLPQYWAAAVDIFGPSNLVTFAKAVPPTWKRFIARFVGDPDTEADFLMERSPITYVEDVQTPLLVIQGATDPRVVKGESEQMVDRLQSLGREVEYVVFDDEGHGF